MLELRIEAVAWQTHAPMLVDIRTAVFVREQGVPLELEMDDRDSAATHLLAFAPDGTAIATGRLLVDGHIGRMAVRAKWRHRGVGRRLLDRLVRIADSRNLPWVFLHAQSAAVGFYEQAGFTREGDIFMDAGIPHQKMLLTLRP